MRRPSHLTVRRGRHAWALPVGFDDAPIGIMLVGHDRVIIAANRVFCGLLGRSEDEILGRTPYDFTPEDDQAISAAFAASVMRDGAAAPMRKRFTRPDGTTVLVEVSSTRIEGHDGQPMFYSQVVDVTERQRVQDELARSVAEQAAVAEIGRRALDDHDVAGVLELAVEHARTLLDALTSSVVTIDGAALRVRAISGRAAKPVPGSAIGGASTRSLSGYTLDRRELVISEDLSTETRFRPSREMLGDGAVSAASVPIRGRSGNLGVLCVTSAARSAFRHEDCEFLQSVANVLASALDRAAEDAVSRHRALHDPLTELPNRSLLLDRLGHALAGRRRRGSQVAALLLDVDGFKLINDSLGHAAGDALLVELAARLQRAVRATDTVGRMSGDEFVVICDVVDGAAGATRVAERLRTSLRTPFTLSGREVLVSGSVGVAVAPDEDDVTADDVLRDADAALYRAKADGRDTVQLFDRQMRERALSRLTLESDLRRALAEGRLDVAYQPIVQLRDGRVVAVEALARWEHPDHGTIPPDQFIPLAEQSDLIVELGEWVLRRASAEVAAWQREIPGADGLRLTVNVSPRQVVQPDFAARVGEILDESGLTPGTLGLEITEGVLIERLDVSVDGLALLRARGVQVLVDDFGTGHSSLSRLRELPINTIKLDQSFVSELASDARGAAIPGAVMGIGHALGLHVVAEGVETEAQRDELLRLGCRFGQGYLFAPPLAPDAARLHLLARVRAARPLVALPATG